MKKKIGLALLLPMMISALAACGASDEKVISGSTEAVVTENTSNTQTQQDSEVAEVSSVAAGYVFASAGAELVIGAEAAPVIEKLGEPVSYFEAASCAFGDLDKIYTYSGFEMDTYSENGLDYISAVILMDDSVATKEGIYIGSPAEDVLAKYGEATTSTDNSYVFNAGAMKLIFLIADGKVSSIQYMNTILD